MTRPGLAKVLLAIFIAMQLAACVDDDNSEAGVAGALAEVSDSSVVASEVVVSGSVGDGPVTGATIIVYSNTGTQIGSMISDNSASFQHTLKTKGKDYPLILEVNGGIDLVTGSEPDFQMLSVMMNPSEKQVNINPFSTLVVKIAQSLPGGIDQNNISLAKSIITDKLSFGLDLNSVPDPITSAITESNVANLVKASEALGEMVRRTRDRISGSGTTLSGDDVVAAIAADMTDGVLDGVGAAGTVRRVAAVANVVSGQVLVEALSNNLKVGGIIATGVIDQAIAITNSSILSSQLTDSVRITQGMLKQARVALAATQVLDSSQPVKDIGNKVASVQADVLPQDVATVLPADASYTLDYAVVLSSTVDDTQLSAVNEMVSSGGEAGTTSLNAAPTISGSPVGSVVAGNSYAFQPTAADADGDALSFSITNKPGWASFSATSGQLSGTPVNGDAGTYGNIQISVSDGTETASLAAFSIRVDEFVVPNSAPVISGSPIGSVVAGSGYVFQPTAADADGDTLSFSIANKPGWASFSVTSGQLSGTPDNGDARTYGNIQISVSDGIETASLAAFSITVEAANTAPTISGSPAGSVVAGNSYAFQPTAADADGDTLSFSIANKPGWASFSVTSGQLSGTPDSGDAGTYGNIQISVSDGAETASLAAFSITVEAAQAEVGGFTLSWTAPTTRADGAPLSLADIDGYRIYLGNSPGNYSDMIDVADGTAQSASVIDLPVDTYYLVMTTYDSTGLESAYSGEISKVAQ
jgi:hypothetical protein